MLTTKYPTEQMHRIKYTKLTEAQISAKLGAISGPTSASPLSDVLAGKSLKIVTDDGPTLSYRFASANKLTVTEGDGKSVQAGYGALTLDHVALFSHLVPGHPARLPRDRRPRHEPRDRVRGLVQRLRRTIARCSARSTTARSSNRASRRRLRATRSPTGSRARAIYWKQDNGIETLEFYPSVLYSQLRRAHAARRRARFCGPSDYVKIDDDLYIYSRIECEFSGIMTLYVLDVNRIRAGRRAARLRRERRARILCVPRPAASGSARSRSSSSSATSGHDDRARQPAGAAGERRAAPSTGRCKTNPI